MEAANAAYLFLRVSDMCGIDALLGLEYGVDAFGGNDRLVLIVKNERRVLTVENHYIDLLAEHSLAVDHMSLSRLISLRQIGLQQFEPDFLAGIPFCTGMAEALSDGFEPLL